MTHTYGSAGSYTAVVTASNSANTMTATTQVTVTAATPVTVTRTITYTYDPLNRLTAATYSTGENYAYQYDAVGNRVAMTDTTGTTSYTYDAANRLTNIQSPTSNIAYSWDDRGNLTHDGVFTYTYSAAGRMVRAESVTVTLLYTYTVDGLRIAQDVDGVVTAFAWDWATGVPEMLSDSENLYLVGLDTLGWEGTGGWAFALPDALGSVRQTVDASGIVVDAREWTPYGVEIDDVQAGLGYTGEWFDDGIGLQYLRARWYDGSGRFTQADPSDLERNPFIYAQSNPIMMTDPTGYFSPQMIAESLGLAQFDPEVLDWFENTGEVLDYMWDYFPWQHRMPYPRWGLLKLLSDAHVGDAITGLYLNTFGKTGQRSLGRFLPLDGCRIGVLTDSGQYELGDFVWSYLYYGEIDNYESNSGQRLRIPDHRNAIYRYRLNHGRTYRDTQWSDLPDFWALTGVLQTPGVDILDVGVSLITDRFGNDYLSGGLSLGLGFAFGSPLEVSYIEGYVSYMDTPRRGAQLGEAQLIDALKGVDFGELEVAVALQTVGYTGELLGDTPYATFVSGISFPTLVSIADGASLTIRLPDIGFTRGWAELDRIQWYERSSF